MHQRAEYLGRTARTGRRPHDSTEAGRCPVLKQPSELSEAWMNALYGRNHDYSPRRYDATLVAIQPKGVSASLAFSDRLTGRVDGMNDHGLCVSPAPISDGSPRDEYGRDNKGSPQISSRLETCLNRKRHKAVGCHRHELRGGMALCSTLRKEPTTRIRDGFVSALNELFSMTQSDPITPPVRGHTQFEAVNAADILGWRVAARAQHKR